VPQQIPSISPRDQVGAGAIAPGMPMPPTKMPAQKPKRHPRPPAAKTTLPKVPMKVPKPQIPGLVKPLGGGTGEANPPVVPRNSPRGVKQQMDLSVPGVKLR
jgi:hypothetical protein